MQRKPIIFKGNISGRLHTSQLKVHFCCSGLQLSVDGVQLTIDEGSGKRRPSNILDWNQFNLIGRRRQGEPHDPGQVWERPLHLQAVLGYQARGEHKQDVAAQLVSWTHALSYTKR